MKTRFTTTLILATCFSLVQAGAQTMADKMAAKMAAKTAGSSSSGKMESQSVTAASFADGEYTWWRNTGNTVLTLEKEAEPKKLTFTKNDKGEVSSIKMGDYEYKGDEDGKSEFVRYFKSTGRWQLFFSGKNIIIFEGEESINLLGSLGSKCKDSEREKIKKFLAEGKEMQKADIEKYNIRKAEEKKAADLEKEKNFSIKDKAVNKIEVFNIKTPEKFGHFASFSFDVKATLKDGKVLSTDNGGFWSDYTITYEGGDYSNNKVQGVINKEDKIKINVVSKFDPAVKTTAEVVLLYNQNVAFNYNATSWSRGSGESANNFKIEVKQMKHKVNGSDVVAVRITNTTTGVVASEFKMGADFTLKFYCKGGSGGKDGGRGNDGGNGGNITVVKDPGVKSFNLEYENYGGKGGKGSSASMDGRNGRDGAYKEEVKPVTF